jgi:hypothetical protein
LRLPYLQARFNSEIGLCSRCQICSPQSLSHGGFSVPTSSQTRTIPSRLSPENLLNSFDPTHKSPDQGPEMNPYGPKSYLGQIHTRRPRRYCKPSPVRTEPIPDPHFEQTGIIEENEDAPCLPAKTYWRHILRSGFTVPQLATVGPGTAAATAPTALSAVWSLKKLRVYSATSVAFSPSFPASPRGNFISGTTDPMATEIRVTLNLLGSSF